MIRSDEPAEPSAFRRWRLGGHTPAAEYGLALAIAAAVTAVSLALADLIGYRAVALLYLLSVVVSAVRLRRGPIFLLAAASALLWDFLFIPPHFTFHISALHDWIMLGLYFVVAVVVGHLTTRMREREQAERKSELRATGLYRLTRVLAASLTLDDAVGAVLRLVVEALNAPGAVLLRDPGGLAAHPASTLTLSPKEESVANWSYQRKQPAGRFTDTLPDAEAHYLPLLAGERCEGVLAVKPSTIPTVEQRDLLDAVASQLASFVQRDRAIRSVRDAQLAVQSERLQKALFDSVSHELKTPLSAVSGLLDLPEPDCGEIRLAVRRLTRTVDHLLDATRLESGMLQPNLEWCAPVELARDAVSLAASAAAEVRVTSDSNLREVRVDAGLISQAISMLLMNAAMHSPIDAPIELHVADDGGGIIFSVLDRGPGIPAGEEDKIFAKFYRGRGAAPGGLGLGLFIARQLAELHGGTLRAQNRSGGGALFAMRLPINEVMRLPEEHFA